MAVYYCKECDMYHDDDWEPAVEHPWAHRFKKYELEMVCQEAADALEYEMLEALKEDLRD